MSEFAIGAYVRKKSGAFWEVTVVGHYSTRQTDDGVAVQLFGWEDGPVQIYPASALEPCDPAEGRLAPQLLTINLSEDELAELQAAARNNAPGKITVATPPPQTHVAGRWRDIEAAYAPGYWGIELEDAGNDDDAILYPQTIHRDTVARIVEAHNAALSPPPAPIDLARA